MKYITEALRPLAVRLDSLKPLSGNPRAHPEKNRGIIHSSLEKFLQVKPIVLASDGVTIIAGNGTFAQAVMLGWDYIAAVKSHLSGAEALAYAIADNKSAEESTWADDLLEKMLGDFDPSLRLATGFDERELAEMFGEPGCEIDDKPVPPPPKVPVTQVGDVWHLGPHRLICRSSADPMTAPLLLRAAGSNGWDAVFTDPPYGVSYVGKTKDALKIQNDGASTLRQLLDQALRPALEYCAPGGAWYVCAPHGPQFLDFAQVLTDLNVWRQTILWIKDAFVMGRSDFHYRHEAIFNGAAPSPPPPAAPPPPPVPAAPAEAKRGSPKPPGPAGKRSKSGTAPPPPAPAAAPPPAPELPRLTPEYTEGEEGVADAIGYGWAPGGSHLAPPGRSQDTCWFIKRPKASRDHPTMKPVALVIKALHNSTRRGARVYDPFSGSGTTLLACEDLGRVCFGCELAPGYCDVIVRRWQEMSGSVAHRFNPAGVEQPGLSVTVPA